MPQTHKAGDSTVSAESRSPAESIADAVAFVRRHLSIMLLTFFVTIGAAVLYLIVAAPAYTATAKLVIDAKAPPVDVSAAATIVESQIAILKSESLARVVIRKRGLAADPEFGAPAGGLRGMVKSIFRLLGLMEPETEFSAMRRTLRSFDRKLSARRVGLTYIVEITFDSGNPERAALILNTVAETHIAAQMEARFKSGLREEKWVKDRISELSTQASAAQNAVTEYETADAGKLSSQSTKAQADRRELEAAAETSTKAYENFIRMLRYMEAQQQSSNTEARLLVEASPPLEASSPKAPIVLGISTAGGVIFGIALGMLRDLLGRGVRVSGRDTRASAVVAVQEGDAGVVNQNYTSPVRRLQNPREDPGAPGAQHAGLRRGPGAYPSGRITTVLDQLLDHNKTEREP